MAVYPTFLDLSPSLRRRIYIEAGLVINSDLNLNGHSDDQPNLSLSRALMLTCRIVHAETSLLLYSTNRFVIRFQHAGDLQALRILRPRQLFTLTCITVLLNATDIPRGPYGHAPINCPKSEAELLHVHSPSAEILFLEWETTADYFARHMKPNALDLGLICDVADLETAKRIVAPLSRFPTVAACHIRLGPSPNPNMGLQQIARDASLQVAGMAKSFNFLRLPPELRVRILEYTDLVAPLNQIVWTFGRSHGGRYSLPFLTWGCRSKPLSCEPPYDVCHPFVHQACQELKCRLGNGNECPHYVSGWRWGPESKIRCWTCSHYACQFRKCWQVNKRGNRQGRFCFCQLHHAAYSPLCQCWAPPKSMFLVSHAFRRDAHQVFFGRNHFDIGLSYSDYFINKALRPARYPESVFLSDVVPASALQYLRSLEFSFLHYNHYPFTAQSQTGVQEPPAEHRDWLRTVNRIMSDDVLGPTFPSLFLKISASDMEGLDAWFSSRPKMPLENPDLAIDTLKAIAAFFWPPLLRGSHTRQKQVLFTLFSSNYMRAGYFVHPGQQQRPSPQSPQQHGRSWDRPLDFATEWERADFRAMRDFGSSCSRSIRCSTEARQEFWLDETAGAESGRKWVEGIWATYDCVI